MTFQAPPYLSPRNQQWDFDSLNKGIDQLGDALQKRQDRLQMEALGKAAQEGGLNALQKEAYGRGNVDLGLRAGNAITRNRLLEAQIAKANRAPAGPAPTATMREYEMAKKQGFKGSILDYKQALRPQNTTTVNVGHEKSFDKEIGKQLAKDFTKYQADGSKARAALNDLNTMEKALEDPNIYTGIGGTTAQAVKRAAQAFGVNVKGVGTGELINTISKKIAVGMKDNLPGPMSDSDRRFLVEMAPGLNYTPEGNRLMIQMAKLQRQYVIDRGRAFRDYAKANGGRPDSSVYSFIDKEVGEKYAQQFSTLIQRLKAEGEAAPRSPAAGFPRAVNPRTGQALIFKDGQWVPE